MRAVTVAKINKSFTDWHWSTKEFDEKLKKYYDNILPNTDDLKYLNDNEYEWAVRNDSSIGKNILKETDKDTGSKKTSEKTVSSEYYWITNKDGVGVVFFKN